MKIVCEKCGSANVQHAYWVNPNSEEVLEPFGTWCYDDNSWCENCQEHTKLVEKDVPLLAVILESKDEEQRYESVLLLSKIFEMPEEVVLGKLAKAGLI